jgi:hypothetical protein
MQEYDAPRAALARVIEQSQDAELRTGARAYLGAALLKLGAPDSAVIVLDAALAGTDDGSELQHLIRIWRGRALLDLGRETGWDDLAAVARSRSQLAVEAGLELATRGLTAKDSVRGGAALARLASLQPGPRADSVVRLLRVAGETWAPTFVRAQLPAHAGENWPAEPRLRMALARAQLAALAGDTAAAIREGRAAAELGSTQASADARVATAAWLLQQVTAPEQLGEVRALLLPSFAFQRPLELVRQVRTLEVLLERARDGQATALFAAGEYARDVLGAPRLARELFIAHSEMAPQAVTAPKALLAALALTHEETERAALRSRVSAYPNNPYVRALEGRVDPESFAAAEERLGRAVSALRADAEAAAANRDVTLTRAITALDSMRVLARNDSLRVTCGSLLDSLGLSGIRADSVRGACLRSDTALVARFLVIDSVQLRDTAQVDTGRVPLPAPAPDTSARN